MTQYLSGFLVYIMAMLGLIFIALVVVKKSLNFGSGRQKNNFLKIESSLNIEPRKNLYVIKAGKERFLISSGIEGCQFMTKIEDSNTPNKIENPNDYINEINEQKAVSQIKIPAIKLRGL